MQIHFVAGMHLHRVERHQSRCILWPGCIFIEGKGIKADAFCGQDASSSRGKTAKKMHFAARVHLHRVERHQSRYISLPGCIFITRKRAHADTFHRQGASSSRGKKPMRIHFTAGMHLHRVERHQSRYISWQECIFITRKRAHADTFHRQSASSSRGKVQKQICSTANYKKKSSIGYIVLHLDGATASVFFFRG